MRIGELSERTGVPVRMLRYYEQRGLLAPERSPNGYREYTEADVDRAGLVSSLIRSGLPTKLIIPLLRDELVGHPDDLAGLLAAESERLRQKIDCMTLSRTTIERYLSRLLADEPVAPARTYRPSSSVIASTNPSTSAAVVSQAVIQRTSPAARSQS